jgi:hypothetical protein
MSTKKRAAAPKAETVQKPETVVAVAGSYEGGIYGISQSCWKFVCDLLISSYFLMCFVQAGPQTPECQKVVAGS